MILLIEKQRNNLSNSFKKNIVGNEMMNIINKIFSSV